MTLLEAAKKGAEWMRWWVEQTECDCESGHSCGLTERKNELEEIETAIKAAEPQDLKTCSICGRKDTSVMKPVVLVAYDGLLCHKCDRK